MMMQASQAAAAAAAGTTSVACRRRVRYAGGVPALQQVQQLQQHQLMLLHPAWPTCNGWHARLRACCCAASSSAPGSAAAAAQAAWQQRRRPRVVAVAAAANAASSSRTTSTSSSITTTTSRSRGRYRDRQQQQRQRLYDDDDDDDDDIDDDDDDNDVLVAPIDPLDGTWAAAGGGGSSSSSGSSGERPRRRGGRPRNGRRALLVKVRVPTSRQRRKQSFDAPRALEFGPEDAGFDGRLTSELNAAFGPRRLTQLIDAFAPHMSAAHAAAALSQLAGQVTLRQLAPQELVAVYHPPAAKAAAALLARLAPGAGGASVADCARALYSLARLRLQQPRLLAAVEAATRGRLCDAPPQALAGLAVGLAHWGRAPAQAWVDELCVEAFAAASGFSAQDLANLLFALATWRAPLSQPMLARLLAAFRGHWGTPGCHAPALVRFAYALASLPPCAPLPAAMAAQQPPGAGAYVHHAAWRERRQLAALTAAMGLGGDGDGGGGGGGDTDVGDAEGGEPAAAAAAAAAAAPAAAAAAPAAAIQPPPPPPLPRDQPRPGGYRLPSFNWLVALFAEARRQVDRLRPAELATLLWAAAALNHTPDLVFMEAWCRASAARMAAFDGATLGVALQALGMLRPGRDVPGGVPGRWLAAALARSRAALPACGGADLSRLLWGLAELRVWPGRAWVDAWLSAAAADDGGGAAADGAAPAAPGETGSSSSSSGGSSRLREMAPAELADAVWALARLRVEPPAPFLEQLAAAVDAALPRFSAQGLAVVVWGCGRLGLRPRREWLLAFRGAAGDAYGSAALARFVAAFLAAQPHRLPRRGGGGGGGGPRRGGGGGGGER